VTFHVRADGRVARAETDPEIDDREFARQFNERAMAYRFKPALDAEGKPVPGVYTMTFTLSSK